MKKFVLLIITAMLFLFVGCGVGHQPVGLDPTTFKIKKISVEKNFKEPEAEDEQENEEKSLPPATETNTIKAGNLTDNQDTGNTTPPISLGLEKKTTPKENKGPAENAKQSASGNNVGKTSASNNGNLSSVWNEIYKLKDRVGVLEDRFDLSPSGNIKEKLVMFKSGSSTELTPEGIQFIKDLIEWSKKGLVENINMNGNASTKGSEGTNLKISEDRAKTVQKILKDNGVDSNINFNGETDRYGHNTNAAITWRKK